MYTVKPASAVRYGSLIWSLERGLSVDRRNNRGDNMYAFPPSDDSTIIGSVWPIVSQNEGESERKGRVRGDVNKRMEKEGRRA